LLNQHPLRMFKLLISFLIFYSLVAQLNAQNIYLTHEGRVTFTSEAPLEIISAQSNELSGAIDLNNNHFAFKIANRSLRGFNSALQQEHFYENYMEVDKFPYSTFQGKIIEKINKDAKGTQKVRAKGTLTIHGVEQERIIDAVIEFDDHTIKINSAFRVMLEDHNIRIPSIVYQKIAENIAVEVHATLLPKITTD